MRSSSSSHPTHGNWIWLVSGLAAAAAVSTAILRYPAAADPAAGHTAAGHTSAVHLADGHRFAVHQAGAGTTGRPREPVMFHASGHGLVTSQTSPARRPFTHAVAQVYDPGGAVGSCTLGPLRAHGNYASLPPQRYGNGTRCGTYLSVRGPRGKVRAEVVDLCPGCSPGVINLSRSAFDRVVGAGPGSGPITYRTDLDPRLPGPIRLRVGATHTRRLAVQVINHGNPLVTVAVAAPRALAAERGAPGGPAAWQRLRPTTNDFWVALHRLVGGPFLLRITDDRGHEALLRRVTLVPGKVIRTRVWMYRAAPVGHRGAKRRALG